MQTQAALRKHGTGKVVPWFQSCVQHSPGSAVICDNAAPGWSGNRCVRKAAEMSHCLEPEENSGLPYGVQRNSRHQHLISDLLNSCAELMTHW